MNTPNRSESVPVTVKVAGWLGILSGPHAVVADVIASIADAELANRMREAQTGTTGASAFSLLYLNEVRIAARLSGHPLRFAKCSFNGVEEPR